MHSSGADRAQGALSRVAPRARPSVTGGVAPSPLALPPLPGPRPRRLKRWAKRIGLLVGVGVVAVGFRVAFPTLIQDQRPSLLPEASASVRPAGTARPAFVPWDAVDVALFLDSCGTSTPADVCRCEASRLPPYYPPEVALALADRSGGTGPLPENYRTVVMACSAG
jgi:hypothetical protein